MAMKKASLTRYGIRGKRPPHSNGCFGTIGGKKKVIDQKTHHSDIPDKFIWNEANRHWKIIAIPRKWWSITEWKFGISFLKSLETFMMRKDKDNGKTDST